MRPITFDIYGARRPALIETVRDQLENVLLQRFDERDSEYKGVYYQAGHSRQEHILLQHNEDPRDGNLAEPRFPDHHLLVYVNNTLDPDRVQRTIQNIETQLNLLHRASYAGGKLIVPTSQTAAGW